MSEMINRVLMNTDFFILLLFRCGALVISSPIFGRVNIPNMAKVALITSFTWLLFSSTEFFPVITYNNLLGFFVLVALEILIGVALGYVTNLVFYLTYVSGQMIDMQIGFGIVNVYDAQSSSQAPMMGNLLNIVLLVVFFSLNGHYWLFEILHRSVEAMPVGGLTLSYEIGLAALEIFARCFTLAVMVAMPVVASGLVIEFCFGMMIRTVPQMNMFVVGIPLKLIVGFILMLFMLPIFVNFSDRLFSAMFEGIDQMFTALAGEI